MSKYERAYNNIIFDLNITKDEILKLQDNDFSVLLELVERATPKKVKKTQYENISKCICNEPVIKNQSYCEYCGQALDWSNR